MWEAEVYLPSKGRQLSTAGDTKDDATKDALDYARKNGVTHEFLVEDRDSEPVWILVGPDGLVMGYANVFRAQ